MFAKYGMPDVEVQKQASWGTTRDNLVLGSEGNGIDGAHILTPMPYLISSGKVTQNNSRRRCTSWRGSISNGAVHLGRQGIQPTSRSASTPRRSRWRWSKKKAAGKAVKAAMTFPGGTHDLWIRYWLAAGGIDPDKDIETITVPPPQMVANMKVGTMDCFCVVRAVEPAVDPSEHRLHRDHHRRNLGQASGKIARHARGLGRQISEGRQGDADGGDGGAAVGEKTENKDEVAAIMGKRQWINCPVEDITDRVKGKFDYGIPGKVVENSPHIMRYWRDSCLLSVPEPRSLVHDGGHPLGQIRSWLRQQGADRQGQPRGYLEGRSQELGVAAADIPASTSRGKETFFDGKVFDPENPAAYLKSLSIKRVEV